MNDRRNPPDNYEHPALTGAEIRIDKEAEPTITREATQETIIAPDRFRLIMSPIVVNRISSRYLQRRHCNVADTAEPCYLYQGYGVNISGECGVGSSVGRSGC